MPHSPHTVFAIFLTVSYSRAAHSKTRYTNPNYIQQHSSNHDASQKFSSKDQSPEPLCNIETTIEPSLNFSPNMFNMLSKIAALPSSKCSAISPYILAVSILSNDPFCVYQHLRDSGFEIDCFLKVLRRVQHFAMRNHRRSFKRIVNLAVHQSKNLRIVQKYMNMPWRQCVKLLKLNLETSSQIQWKLKL